MGDRHSRILAEIGELRRPFHQDDPDAPKADPLREAYERGYEEGLAEGRRQSADAFDREMQEVGRRLGETVQTLGDLHSRIVRDYKATMIELALEAASRIARGRIEADDPVAARALQEALDDLPVGQRVRVRVHPDDLESIRDALAREIEKQRVELQADDEISRGGCVVQGETGIVDATLETAEASVRLAAEGRPQ